MSIDNSRLEGDWSEESAKIMSAAFFGELDSLAESSFFKKEGVDHQTSEEYDMDGVSLPPGTTALMAASRYDEYHVVQYLLEKGASVNVKNAKRQTALDFAHNEIESHKSRSGALLKDVMKNKASYRSMWEHVPRSNCYDGHGGQNVDLEKDNHVARKLSIEEAQILCVVAGYAGFTYCPRGVPGKEDKYMATRTWFLRRIDDKSKFRTDEFSSNFDVYILK
eukprot:gnl/MRDRNA2_/MRDRNA2_123909_c0_seq1.p1 gnl/MRDRNA2_/MRDRNA2_123909_c0~~gnl/MRDRNA2_/MRDRNA2_123909_c0_seq1.p1  ORF type:complete len:222 (-),score=33.95 gnl/MRDRNA2_/MRDRNA2_123909_c0_seq1:204-869(-)